MQNSLQHKSSEPTDDNRASEPMPMQSRYRRAEKGVRSATPPKRKNETELFRTKASPRVVHHLRTRVRKLARVLLPMLQYFARLAVPHVYRRNHAFNLIHKPHSASHEKLRHQNNSARARIIDSALGLAVRTCPLSDEMARNEGYSFRQQCI